ncbi:MAG: hypothetical protein RL336_1317 [Pseudomonadota bacterium]|jgi:uncharacterized protein (DUF1800 family)
MVGCERKVLTSFVTSCPKTLVDAHRVISINSDKPKDAQWSTFMQLFRSLSVLLTVFMLASCGGGSASSPKTPTPSPSPTSPTPATPTPDPAPPKLHELAGNTLALDVTRFLNQATFGPTQEEIIALVETEGDFERWIDTQQALPFSSALHRLDARMNLAGLDPSDESSFDGELVWRKQMFLSDILWESFVRGEDQLRQRVAFALSQIFVISQASDALYNDTRGIANYHDILAKHAFGNYRDLLEAVTTNPMMGEYLSMVRNEKADPSRNIRPDENYAREMMQLFTIGLVELNDDGTPQYDQNNQTLPTYNQDTIKAFASVFTGWLYGNANTWNFQWPNSTSDITPMKPFEAYHDGSPKTLLNNTVTPAGLTARADLTAALDNVFAHRNVAPFVSKQLIQRLVTSNPTPDYVARISAVFNDNGKGEKGDLAAVVKAILLDPEARRRDTFQDDTYGKLKEPTLKVTALMRAFDVTGDQPITADGSISVDTLRFLWPSIDMGQRVYGSPSVFNFYRPDYHPANTFEDDSLLAPELQILNEKNITAISNWGGNMVFNAYDFVIKNCLDGLDYNNAVGCLKADFTDEIERARSTSELLDHLSVLMLNGQMSPTMRATLASHINTFDNVDATERLYRVAETVYLTWLSPEFAVQR